MLHYTMNPFFPFFFSSAWNVSISLDVFGWKRVGWTSVHVSFCSSDKREAALTPLSVSGLQGCDLVQGNDMAVDEMIKDNVALL